MKGKKRKEKRGEKEGKKKKKEKKSTTVQFLYMECRQEQD